VPSHRSNDFNRKTFQPQSVDREHVPVFGALNGKDADPSDPIATFASPHVRGRLEMASLRFDRG
jgi:hypothetical protein